MGHHHHNGAAAPGLAAPELADTPAADPAPLGASGAAAAGLTAGHKDEAPRLAGAEGFRDQGRGDTPDCAGSAAVRQPAGHPAHFALPVELGKDAATLQARAALLGVELLPLDGGRWRLVAGADSADLASLQAAAAWVYGLELASREGAA